MWVFGAFLFDESTMVVAYIFTILNSLQGALVFIMHCLLSKQVENMLVVFMSVCVRACAHMNVHGCVYVVVWLNAWGQDWNNG